jgi:hypothetical protein
VVVVVVGLCARKMRGGEGCWAETQNRAVVAWFRACCVQQRWGMVREGGAVARTKWQWLWGCGFTKREARRGGLGRNPKPSRYGSVEGTPCGTAMGVGVGQWHVPGGDGWGVVRLRNARREGGLG